MHFLVDSFWPSLPLYTLTTSTDDRRTWQKKKKILLPLSGSESRQAVKDVTEITSSPSTSAFWARALLPTWEKKESRATRTLAERRS